MQHTPKIKCECNTCGYDFEPEEMSIHNSAMCVNCAHEDRDEKQLSHCCNATLENDECNTSDDATEYGDHLICSDCGLRQSDAPYEPAQAKRTFTVAS